MKDEEMTLDQRLKGLRQLIDTLPKDGQRITLDGETVRQMLDHIDLTHREVARLSDENGALKAIIRGLAKELPSLREVLIRMPGETELRNLLEEDA